MLEQRRAPGARLEDFVPWVAPISSCPSTSEEEKDENEMANLVHNFGAWKSKRDASSKLAIDVTPKVVGEVDQHPTGKGSDGQAIVFVDSPEIGFHGQLASQTVATTDLGKVSLTHEEVWKGIPSEHITSRPDNSTSSRFGHNRSLLPDRLLLNLYIPP